MKFIHTADIHLGAAPDSTMPWAKNRGDELWESFYRLLDEVERSETDLLLIAGDLFHRAPLKRELKEVNYRLEQLKHTQVVIIAGNHDYIGEESYYHDFEWAPNVFFFRKNHMSYAYLEELQTIIYGMSYDRQEIRDGLYDGIQPKRYMRDGSALPKECHHILLAHGGDSTHIPINQDRLKQAGFDYVALGHIHKPWVDQKSCIAYSGALEPIDRNDEGAHGYIRGTIDENGTEIEFVPFARRSYITLQVTMNTDMTMAELVDDAKVLMGEKGRENVFQIVVDGFKSADFEMDERMLMRIGRVLSVTDRTITDFDYDQIYADNKDNIIGMYIQRVSEMDISDSVKEKALSYGLKALYQIK